MTINWTAVFWFCLGLVLGAHACGNDTNTTVITCGYALEAPTLLDVKTTSRPTPEATP